MSTAQCRLGLIGVIASFIALAILTNHAYADFGLKTAVLGGRFFW